MRFEQPRADCDLQPIPAEQAKFSLESRGRPQRKLDVLECLLLFLSLSPCVIATGQSANLSVL